MASRLKPIQREIRIAESSVWLDVNRVELTEVVDIQLQQILEDRPFLFGGPEHLEMRQWILRVPCHDWVEF